MGRRPPRSTLVPYPTPFRSDVRAGQGNDDREQGGAEDLGGGQGLLGRALLGVAGEEPGGREPPGRDAGQVVRSEAHTSELQSRQYLVCRLLLENMTSPTVPS